MSTHRLRCGEVGSLLPAYLEGEMDSGAMAAVRAHLDRCPVCRADSQRMDRALAALRTLQPSEMPVGVRSGLYARIAELESPRYVRGRRMRLAGAAVTVAIAAVCTAYLGLQRSEEKPAPVAVAGTAQPAPGIAATVGPREPAAMPARPQEAASLERGADGTAQAARRVARRMSGIPEARPSVTAPSSFLDVTDMRGVSARMLLEMQTEPADGRNRPVRLPSPVLPPVLRDYESGDWNDRVRIGETVTEMRGTAERDEAGGIRAIRVVAETVSSSADARAGDGDAAAAMGAAGLTDAQDRSRE